jgi:hypothetical protein
VPQTRLVASQHGKGPDKLSKAPSIRDFWLIALIQLIGKLVSKILAHRLAAGLPMLVHKSQSAFIRYIQDNFRFVHSAVKLLHVRQQACLLLKVNVAKAFDLVAWPVLLEVLQFMGFLTTWREWISTLLSTASTKIMLNGVLGDIIHHGCGLRQGDPLSPMMFLLIMEALSALIRRADGWSLPQDLGVSAIPQRVAFYVDDLILFIRPATQDLLVLREIFILFEGTSGLGCNLTKCQMILIRCTKEQTQLAATTFPCQLGQFPAKYLGVPLSVWKLPRAS